MGAIDDRTTAVMRYLHHAVIAVSVFAAGACIMVYEFLAVRFLARYFGSALDVWASEIAVIMAGLSLGYALGGWVADKRPSWFAVGGALMLAGVTGAPMEIITTTVGETFLQYTIQPWHSLATAFAASFLPVFFLGAVLPQGIKLAAPSLAKVGSAAGCVSAVSTVGSIVGVIMIGHYLLLHFGMRNILYTTSAILTGAGILIMAVAWWRRIPAAAIALLIAFPAPAQVIFNQYSAYHHILVEDRGNSRLLRFDNDVQSTMSLQDPYSGGFEYADYFHMPVLFNPSLERVLFIGLGGGTGPKSFLQRYNDVRIDVIEIDPKVVEVAREYFALPRDPQLNVRTGDGRAVLQRTGAKYDAIMIDAYGSGPRGAYLPYHLATREFFTIVKDHLKNGGVLVYNAVGAFNGMNASTINSVAVTLRDSFYTTYIFGAQSSINTVFVCVHIDPSQLDDEGLVDGKAWPNGPWLQHPMSGWDLQQLVGNARQQHVNLPPNMEQRVNQFSMAHGAPINAPVLTDDQAPVDISSQRRR